MQEFHFTQGLCEMGQILFLLLLLLLLWIPPEYNKWDQILRKQMIFKDFSSKVKKTQSFFQYFGLNTMNTQRFLSFFPQHQLVWVSLTCSPDHRGRQCRNFTLPRGSVKWHKCCCYYCCCYCGSLRSTTNGTKY